MSDTSIQGFLVMVHCESNTGYAIGPLEQLFFQVGRHLASDDPQRVHFTYPGLDSGRPRNLEPELQHVRQFDFRTRDRAEIDSMAEYVRHHRIDTVLGFDLSPNARALGPMRRAGVRSVTSYLGAPMSSINRGPMLWAKRLDVALRRHAPDHYLFESEAMRRTATHGRGIPHHKTSLVRLGIDTELFADVNAAPGYAHRTFDIPEDRRIIFYSGHMEPRKGVHVIIEAARQLIDEHGRRDIHFLLLGNRNGEEKPLIEPLAGTRAADHVTFGGYREDLPLIQANSHVGVIASTGWDSFPRSALEMAAAGLPLVVSRLQGLVETIEDGRTGHLFEPGDAAGLAEQLTRLLDDPAHHRRLADRARERVLQEFSRERQRDDLTRALRQVIDSCH